MNPRILLIGVSSSLWCLVGIMAPDSLHLPEVWAGVVYFSAIVGFVVLTLEPMLHAYRPLQLAMIWVRIVIVIVTVTFLVLSETEPWNEPNRRAKTELDAFVTRLCEHDYAAARERLAPDAITPEEVWDVWNELDSRRKGICRFEYTQKVALRPAAQYQLPETYDLYCVLYNGRFYVCGEHRDEGFRVVATKRYIPHR